MSDDMVTRIPNFPLERKGERPRAAPQPLLLVLDLDETLVRVRCEGVHHKRKLDKVDFSVSVDLAEPPKSKIYECGVALRPGLDAFLEWIQERRSDGLMEGPWIFTTSSAKFTKAMLRKIDPGGRIFAMRVLTQDKCSPANLPGYFLKDLARVPPQDGHRRKILVDNNPVSHVLHPESAVLVRDWLGDDPHDTELARVRALLDDLMMSREALDGDYAAVLAGSTPGHIGFQGRLQALGAQLSTAPPSEVEELRTALRAVATECNDIKRELLGAAP